MLDPTSAPLEKIWLSVNALAVARRERRHTTTWPAFIRTHLALLAGTDFFTAEVLTLRGRVTYYVLFFIHLESAGWTSPESPFTQTSRGCSRSPGT